jgi:hypothetical protein
VQNSSHFVISGFLFRTNAVSGIGFACNVRRSGLITEPPTKWLFIRILFLHQCLGSYRVFQKVLYNIESLYKFIQRTCTAIMYMHCHNIAEHTVLPGIVTVQRNFHWLCRVFKKKSFTLAFQMLLCVRCYENVHI